MTKLKFTKKQKEKVFELPVEQKVIVPSTKQGDKPISKSAFNKRINKVREYLSKNYGGYTSVSARGGYYSEKKKKVIKEPVTIVTSFSTNKAFRKNKPKLFQKIAKWGKSWGQESMGYEHEGDLYYIESGFPASQRKKMNKRKSNLKNKIKRKKRK
jgi:hypothetical protein